MKASKLIHLLQEAIDEHGDQNVLLVDHESGYFNSVKGVKKVEKNEYNYYEGIELIEDTDF